MLTGYTVSPYDKIMKEMAELSLRVYEFQLVQYNLMLREFTGSFLRKQKASAIVEKISKELSTTKRKTILDDYLEELDILLA